ncbi:Myb-DNA-bind-2 domain-containing protein [Mycena indigotica]|uniref:Myb-DNA-bind-2 domain-containing protein n=1 Tax=Mycena indigotica TaxID=2126181 RepID=A0A8H6SX49_9AGAR|nr:Myb-DNA-bind-2 domain-containing protein [Mycena indigotica]KAF7306750.1 Myb-DNA-bind-2 domain-containing protein [Mycena indigotica]
MPPFQDSNGLAIKFFIQKDLSQDLQAELCETITALGGRVEAKVPRQGYILVNPNTPEEERLRLCWTSADRPERYFVPYTFVEACKISGMLLKQLFIENNAPIPMHIHSSIANINARSALSARIRHSGGDPTASIATARVILADPHTEVFHHLVQTYQSDPNKYIESYLWIKKCIERGIMTYTPVVYKNPGGRRPGEDRTLFTEEDEHNLCVYIAAKIPFKETGGRTGNRIYTQLCDMKDDPEYAWVQRHTWQSWRERYKKNSERLDKLIATIVAQTNPAHGEKGQYGYVRQPEEKPKKSRRRPAKESPPTDDEQSDTGRSPVAGPSKRPEKNVDEDDESEWAVRVGTSPPPAWAGEKRKANGNDETLPAKRSKSNVRIDEEIANIAREYMFTTEEPSSQSPHAAFDAISLTSPNQHSDPAFSTNPYENYLQVNSARRYNAAMPAQEEETTPTQSRSSFQMSSQLSSSTGSILTTPSSSSSYLPMAQSHSFQPPSSPPPDYEPDPSPSSLRPIPSRIESAPEFRHVDPPGLGPRSQTVPPPRKAPPSSNLDRIDELDESNPLGVALHHEGPFQAVTSMLRTPAMAERPERPIKPPKHGHVGHRGISPGDVLPPNFFLHYQQQTPSQRMGQPYQAQHLVSQVNIRPQALPPWPISPIYHDTQYDPVEQPSEDEDLPSSGHYPQPSQDFDAAYGGIVDESIPPSSSIAGPSTQAPINRHHFYGPPNLLSPDPRILRAHDPNVPKSTHQHGHSLPAEYLPPPPPQEYDNGRLNRPASYQPPRQAQAVNFDPHHRASLPPPRSIVDRPETVSVAPSIATSAARRGPLPQHVPRHLVMPTPLQQTNQLPQARQQARFEPASQTQPTRAQNIQMVQDPNGGRHLLRKRSTIQQPVNVMPPKARPRPTSYMEPPPTIPMAPITRPPEQQDKKRPKRLLSKRRTDL